MIALDSSHRGFIFNLNHFLSIRPEDSQVRIEKDEKISSAISKVRLLNLHKAIPVIEQFYPNCGRKARRQFEMLRALILMPHFGYNSISLWYAALDGDPLIAGICGFFDGKIPPVGSFYNLARRFSNMPVTSHVQPEGFNLSESLKRAKQEKKKGKNKKDKWGDDSNPKVADLVQPFLDNPDNDDFVKCTDFLNAIFRIIGIEKSIELGLIDPDHIKLSGDGTALHEHAVSTGRELLAQPGFRWYSDPDARWGWDSDLETFFFGRHVYLLGSYRKEFKKDLPLYFSMDPANMHDSILGVEAIKDFHRLNSDLTISAVCLDSAHDNESTYQLLQALKAQSYIDPNLRGAKGRPPSGIYVDPNGGTVTCPAKLKMYNAGWDKTHQCYKFRCPVHVKKCGVACCPLGHECSNSKSGRWYNLYPKGLRADGIARSQTKEWKVEYTSRTTCERLNKRVLNDYGMHKSYARDTNVMFFMLFACCLNIHMDAWVRIGAPG